MRLASESKIGRKLNLDDKIWPRMIEYAVGTFNRFEIGDDGMSFFKRLKGRESS